MYGTVVLAIAILLIKGTNGGQTTLFTSFIHKTIEETSVSVLSSGKSESQGYLADISSLTAWENTSLTATETGTGGPGSSIEPTTIQENSVFAHNPANTDYADAVAEKRSGIAEYTVQPGDSLSFIARDYGVSIESIMWANGLRDSNSIREGNILKIPPVSGVVHTVKSGDSISSIAKKYGANSDEIIAYNDLPLDGKLRINDELIIPDGKIATVGTSYTATAISFGHLPDLGNYFAPPTSGRISQWLHGRNAIDIANSWGTPIYAAASGTIVAAVKSGYNGGYGLFVKISHPNGTDTLYAHLSKVSAGVVVGETVQKGQQIGSMGSTGRSTGNHLHFEVHGAKNLLSK